MLSEIPRLVDELVAHMKSGSAPAYRTALERLADTAQAGGPESLTATVEALAPLLPGLGGDFAMTAVLAGACVEWGASPTALVDVLPQRASEAMMLNEVVPELWAKAARGRPLPEPVSASSPRLVRTLTRAARWRRGVDKGTMTRIAMSWFDMDDWLKALITVMTDEGFRAAVSGDVKADLRERAAAVAHRSQPAAWVGALAAVLDDEPLIVIDPRTHRAYALTMSGIGDNGQLHILLADRLVGDPGQGLAPGIAQRGPGSRRRPAATPTSAPTTRRSAASASSTARGPTSVRRACLPTSKSSTAPASSSCTHRTATTAWARVECSST
ncbi:hypothetical protein [Streptomyces sp. NPDC001635]